MGVPADSSPACETEGGLVWCDNIQSRWLGSLICRQSGVIFDLHLQKFRRISQQPSCISSDISELIAPVLQRCAMMWRLYAVLILTTLYLILLVHPDLSGKTVQSLYSILFLNALNLKNRLNISINQSMDAGEYMPVHYTGSLGPMLAYNFGSDWKISTTAMIPSTFVSEFIAN